MDDEPAPKRIRLSDVDLEKLTKEDLMLRWRKQESYITALENKTDLGDHNAAKLSEMEDRLHQQQSEYARKDRKDRLLVMRLATKEQELQEMANQLTEMTKGQAPGSSQLRSALLDPALNLIFQRMRKELEDKTKALQQAQDDMSAWKFTADSQMGKRLMSRCRTLIQENQELGKQVSAGRTARLETELALQKKYSEELKGSQDELNDFVIELDEEVVGMQSTICALQQQLKDAKLQLANVKSSKLVEPPAATPAAPVATPAPLAETKTAPAVTVTPPPVTNTAPVVTNPAFAVTVSAPKVTKAKQDQRTSEVKIKVEPSTIKIKVEPRNDKMDPRTYDSKVAQSFTEKSTRQSEAIANEPASWATFERPGVKSPSTPTEEEPFRIPEAPRTLEMGPMSPAIPEEAAASNPAPQEEAAMKPRTTAAAVAAASSSLSMSPEQPMEVDTNWIKKEVQDQDRTFQVPPAEQQVDFRTTDDRSNPQTIGTSSAEEIRNKRTQDEEKMETAEPEQTEQMQTAAFIIKKEKLMETSETEPVPVKARTLHQEAQQVDGVAEKTNEQINQEQQICQPEPLRNESDDHTVAKVEENQKQDAENQKVVSENQTTISATGKQAEVSSTSGENLTMVSGSKASEESSTAASSNAPGTTNGNARTEDEETANKGTELGSSTMNHDTKNGEFSPARPVVVAASPPPPVISSENNNQGTAVPHSNCNQVNNPSSNNIEEDHSSSAKLTEDGTTVTTAPTNSLQAVQNSSETAVNETSPSAVSTDRTNSPVKQMVKTNDGDGSGDGGLPAGETEGQTNLTDVPLLRENGPETVSN